MFSAVALEFERVMVEYGDWMLDEMIDGPELDHGVKPQLPVRPADSIRMLPGATGERMKAPS